MERSAHQYARKIEQKFFPSLTELQVSDHEFSSDEAIQIITEFAMLKQFLFILRDDCDALRKQLNYK